MWSHRSNPSGPLAPLLLSGGRLCGVVCLAAVGLGCSLAPASPRVGATPSSSSEQVAELNQRQRNLARPPLVDDGQYVWVEAQREFNVPPAVWWERFFAAPLSDILGPAPTFPGVKRTILLRGETWDHPGARRRIEFHDGHSAIEELLAFDPPHTFRTQFWDLTSDDRRGVAHGTSRWTITPLDDGQSSLVLWRYGLKPHNPIVGLVVRRKAEQEVRPDQLEASLQRLDGIVEPPTKAGN
ncbi:MAG: SRPBCC family protein [Planctomycetota bacterium]